jgi:hypothetical protein
MTNSMMLTAQLFDIVLLLCDETGWSVAFLEKRGTAVAFQYIQEDHEARFKLEIHQ